MQCGGGFAVSIEAVRIIGFAALFAIVYAILYRPVLRMLESEKREEEPDIAPDQESGQEGADHNTARTPWYQDRIMLSIAVIVFVADQVTKYIVKSNLALYESWPREGLVRLTYGTNSGTAFGLFPDQTLVLIITSFLAIGFIYYFYRSHALPSRVLRLAIGLQLGGAFGNLVDRVRLGSVVDFIDVGWWPIFNLADSSIVTGIGLLALIIFLTPRERDEAAAQTDRIRHSREEPAPYSIRGGDPSPDATTRPACNPPEAAPPQADARDDAHVQG